MMVMPDPRSVRGGISLALQLVLLAVLPALLAAGALIALAARQQLLSVEEHARSEAQAVARQLASAAQVPLAQDDRRALLGIARAGMTQPHVQQVSIWSGEGELLARARHTGPSAGAGLRAVAPVLRADGGAPAQVTIDLAPDAWAAAERAVWHNVLVALAVCVGGVLLAGVWAARRISAPVRELAGAVERLGSGQQASVRVGGAPEVRRLQQGFNAAATALHDHRRLLEQRVHDATAELAHKNRQIEQASQAKTRLLAAASHDLRQPLHALTLFSQGLARGETDPVRLERIRHVRDCVASLDHLFAELLDISQLDAGVLKPRWSDFALDRVFDDVSRNFRSLAEERQLRLVARHTDLWVHSDYFMLARIVGNLVANSVRHTQRGGVLVAARRRGAQVRIDVVDTGIGIAPEHLEHIFDEFYQVEPAAGEPGRGLGLGLATVQRLAQLLGASVSLRSQPGRGTWVRIEVPLAQPRVEPLVRPPPEAAAAPRAGVGAPALPV